MKFILICFLSGFVKLRGISKGLPGYFRLVLSFDKFLIIHPPTKKEYHSPKFQDHPNLALNLPELHQNPSQAQNKNHQQNQLPF